MPMDGQHSPRFDGVQHALGQVLGAVPEVQVHAEPRGGFRLGGEVVQDVLVDDHFSWSSTSYTELLLLYSGTICFILRTVAMLSNCLAMSTSSSISRETSS